VNAWALRLFFAILFWAWVAVFFIFAVGVPSVQALAASAVLLSVYLLVHRRDLLPQAIWSAVLMVLVLFFLFEIAFFRSGALGSMDATLLHTPVEALIWAASLGCIFGPLYEYARGWKIKP
jgi:hypothetical protein